MSTRTRTISTGTLAREAALSEKAVRLYADRGLLRAERDPAGARVFAGDQVVVARRIALLRGLDVSLDDVGRVLAAADPVAVFDDLWSSRRHDADRTAAGAEYVRARLADSAGPPPGIEVTWREVPERLLLSLPAAATLPELPEVLGRASGELLERLAAAGVPLAGPLHVGIRTRATESYPADLVVCAPVPDLVRPPAGLALTTDPAHREVVVALEQHQADDQALVVAVHDHLSTSASAGGPGGPDVRAGDNREVYLPSFGTGAAGTVMEVVVPVRDGVRPA
jgi:DNA-binding transcriptional MerR regulator